MADRAVILPGLATSNEGDAQSLLFTASPWGLIVNKFTIYNKWHIRRRKSRRLPDWMKKSSYNSTKTGILTSDLTHSMTMTFDK